METFQENCHIYFPEIISSTSLPIASYLHNLWYMYASTIPNFKYGQLNKKTNPNSLSPIFGLPAFSHLGSTLNHQKFPMCEECSLKRWEIHQLVPARLLRSPSLLAAGSKLPAITAARRLLKSLVLWIISLKAVSGDRMTVMAHSPGLN